ncbi:MAG: nitrite reductase [Acidobacteria bacterium RIFCSPLOWO2_12_FULL_67_14b]|nr:MAG: nitrite reductase [Acidobacteria bacterium RIFCSPLOWO2_12_FULL_67_14b]
MAAHDSAKTLGRARLSFAREADIDEFADMLGRFERGEITPDQWRVFRLVRGTYGQRQVDDAQMIRVKIPQGVLTVEQLHALADVAERYSRGFGHITTRQNVQFHFVKLHDAEPAMRRLADAGLTTREACGNSVRNITACQFAGVAADEPFDVTPYAEALTRFLLRHPLSSSLPRKFKIAFEGCGRDHIKLTINDIGWLARVVDGRRGFRVYIGGGTATMTTAAAVLFDFLPVEDMLRVAEAVIRLFHERGDYQHKQRNRMKFLIKALGWEAWRAAFDVALAQVRADGGRDLVFDVAPAAAEAAPAWPRAAAPAIGDIARRVEAATLRGPGIVPGGGPAPAGADGFAPWVRTNVRPQKQLDFVSVVVTVPLGDLSGAQYRILGDLANAYGDGTVRVTAVQDLVFRWVRRADLLELYRRLQAAGLGLPDADSIADVTSCPGAESCKLAVTQSRGLGQALERHLRATPDLIELARELDIKISGCPNGCGQHHVATIGFQGSLRKVDGKAVPQYFIQVGGGIDAARTTFGRLAAKVPARRAAAALERLVRLYADEKQGGETPVAFFRRLEVSKVKALLHDLETLTADTASDADYIDLAETTTFRPKTTDGECAT